jgi:predicted aspartyl protease
MTIFSRSSLLRRASAAMLACALAAAVHAEETDPKSCHYLRGKTAAIRYGGPGLGITMDGRINGAPAEFLVNTGASTTMLTLTGAEKRGLKLRDTLRAASGIGGNVRLYSTQVDEFIAGPAHSTGLTMSVLGEAGPRPSYDGFLGAPFLLQADLEFHLAAKTLNFFRGFGPSCKDTHLAYWDPAAVVVPFERSAEPNPRFPVLLNGRKFSAIINSSASVSGMTRDTAEAIGLDMDGPGVEKLDAASGIGEERVARWAATVDKLEIGNEAITHARLDVLDARLGADVVLGADFLRSHRVLFAMSQKNLYLSYVGGPTLGRRKGIEPWLAQEAEQGNPHAQLRLALMYGQGSGVARDLALSGSWLEKAAAKGSMEANTTLGQALVMESRHAQAIPYLRRALASWPGERYATLWLHAARLGNGEGALWLDELALAFARDDRDRWPHPIARYYLGKIDRDKLLEQAREDGENGQARTCLALLHISAKLRSTGDVDGAKAALAQRDACLPRPTAP